MTYDFQFGLGLRLSLDKFVNIVLNNRSQYYILHAHNFFAPTNQESDIDFSEGS